ncbi:MAG: hypothetical protein AAGG48_29940 [Planctomycetota bacterium]
MRSSLNRLLYNYRMNAGDQMIRSLFQQAAAVALLTVVSVMSVSAQTGNQAVMFGKQVTSNRNGFVISQANPEPRELFVFSSGRNSARFVSRLPAPTKELSAKFGDTIAMSSSVLVVGNPRANSGKGSVLVYPVSRAGRVGTSAKALQPNLSYRYGQFGAAISAYENLIAIGAPQASPPGQASGVVSLFEQQGGGYKPLQEITAGGSGGEIAQFGGSLAIDDKCLVVGVPAAASNRRGEVRVFPRDGKSYANEPALVLDDSQRPDSSYGWLLEMTPEWLVVSALEKTAICDGAVYAYRRNKDGSIEKDSKIHVQVPAGTAKSNDTFGGAIAVIDSLLFVSLVTPSTSGKVLIFDLEKTSVGVVNEVVQTLEPPNRTEPDQFGESMAVLGTNILIGSPPPIASRPLLGAAYLFTPDRKGVYGAAAKIDRQNGVRKLR